MPSAGMPSEHSRTPQGLVVDDVPDNVKLLMMGQVDHAGAG